MMRRPSATPTISRRTPFQEGYAGRWPWLLVIALLVLLPGVVRAQDENRAGLVVVFGDGRVERQCVAFAEDTITGYQLLERAGLPLSVEAGAIGPTVCSIDQEGCSFPAESCFCRCQGSPCVYWSYWRLEGDGKGAVAWRYQSLGAGNTKVRSGDVEGWRWAAGTTQDAEEPPAVSYAEICGEPAAQAVADTSAVTSAVTGTAAVTEAVRIYAPLGNVEPENKAAAGRERAAGTGLDLIWIVLAGVIVVPAAALVMLGLLRRRR